MSCFDFGPCNFFLLFLYFYDDLHTWHMMTKLILKKNSPYKIFLFLKKSLQNILFLEYQNDICIQT